MNIELTRKTKLLTANKVCREDIIIEPVLQEKTVTEKGVYVPDNGYVGFSKINVEVAGSGGIFDSLGDPHAPKFGRLKYLTISPSRVLYKDVGVYTNTYPSLGFSFFQNAMSTYAYADATGTHTQQPMNVYEGDASDTYTDKDGNVYTLYKHTDILAYWNKVAMDTISVKQSYVPACTCKIYLLDSLNNILTSEYEIPATVMPEQNKSASGQWCYAFRQITIGCNYSGNSIIGAEFIYPKETITYKCTVPGVVYTFDGYTSKPITDGLVLKDVEHIGIAYEGAGTLKFGSTPGASDLGTHSSGTSWSFSDGSKDNSVVYISL